MSTPCPNCGCIRPTVAEQRYHNARCGNVGYSIIGDSLFGGVVATVGASTFAVWFMTGWSVLACFTSVCSLLGVMVAVVAWQDRQYKLGKRD